MNTNYELLCWCWKHKQLGTDLLTTKGVNTVIIDVGLHNHKDGPTFFNAKIKQEGLFYVGYVMILDHASEWYLKGYDHNKNYRNVILIVCNIVDAEPIFEGKIIPVVQAEIREQIVRNAKALLSPMTGQISCKGHIMEHTSMLMRHAWFAALQTENIENSSSRILSLYKECKDWEKVFFITLFRGYGFDINTDAMENLARSIPLSSLEHHRDDLFQVEAFIMGQAGLLSDINSIPEKCQKDALNEGYFAKLRNEYLYLAHKYSMKPITDTWKSYGKGRNAYPHIFLDMLANFYYKRVSFGCVLALKDASEADRLLNNHCTPYWETHNHFGMVSAKNMKCLTTNRKCMLIMNVVVPFLFAYGRERNEEIFCDLAFDIMEQLKPYSTPESEGFKKYGCNPSDAGETLAMTQLQRQYCDRQACLRCRFGCEYIRRH